MGLPKNELIAKLEKISALYKDTVKIQAEMNEFEPDDCYDRQIYMPIFPGEDPDWEEYVDHKDLDAAEQMGALYANKYCPKKPVKSDIGKRPEGTQDEANKVKSKLGCLPGVAGFVAVCSLISGGLFSGEAGTVIGNIVILIACAVAILFFFKKYKAAQQNDTEATKAMLEAYDGKLQEAEKQYQQDMNAYQAKHADYISSKDAFLEEYAAWKEIYLEHVQEEEEIEEKLEADRQAAVEKIHEERYLPALAALNEYNDLVAEEYLPALKTIIDLLKSNRADDLKEAINLFEEIVYKERQLQLQREQEQQRQREEEQRRIDEERHHREQMKFQQDQERQRRQEEEQRRKDEDRRHREDMKAREAEARRHELQEKERIRKEQANEARQRREQQHEQWQAAKKQCQACAHAERCSMSIRNRTPTCTGFTPKR